MPVTKILGKLEMTVGKKLEHHSIAPKLFLILFLLSRHFSTAKEKMPVTTMRRKLEMTVGKSASDYFDLFELV